MDYDYDEGQVKELNIAGCNYIIENPEIVKVRTIKRKYVDQLPDFHEMLRNENPVNVLESSIRFLGYVGQTIVLTYKGQLRTTQKMDLIKKYIDEIGGDYKKAYTKAWDIVDKIPRLFAL